MSLISIIIALVAIGLVMWAINTYIPSEGNIRKLLNVVVIVIIVVFLLRVTGVMGYLEQIRI